MNEAIRRIMEKLEHNVTASGGQQLERRVSDLTLWFYKNKDSIPPEDLQKRVDFLEKSIWILIEISALQADRIHELEDRSKSKVLFLPKGMRVEGSVREYG